MKNGVKKLIRRLGQPVTWYEGGTAHTIRAVFTQNSPGKISFRPEGIVMPEDCSMYAADKKLVRMRRGDTVRNGGLEYYVLQVNSCSSFAGDYYKVTLRSGRECDCSEQCADIT